MNEAYFFENEPIARQRGWGGYPDEFEDELSEWQWEEEVRRRPRRSSSSRSGRRGSRGRRGRSGQTGRSARPSARRGPASGPGMPEDGARSERRAQRLSRVQRCLARATGEPLEATGAMGPETRAAIRTFQERQGLEVTGRADPETRQALKEACRPPAEEEEYFGPFTSGSKYILELGEEQEVRITSLEINLEWLRNNYDRSQAFTVEQVNTQLNEPSTAKGVYIVVDNSNKRILKVGKTDGTMARRIYSEPHSTWIKENRDLRYYYATIQHISGGCPIVGCINAIEHLLSRTLIRAGLMRDVTTHASPVDQAIIEGTIIIRNILPEELNYETHLRAAYRPQNQDSRGKVITHRSFPAYEGNRLVIRPLSGTALGRGTNTYWELEF